MKRTSRAGRRRKIPSASISMFPFLAVLVCTMGALIVLLVVITRQARLSAARAADEARQQQRLEVESEREMAEWRVEQLRASRDTTQQQLDEMRAQLGHLEDHARRLETELEQTRQAWNELQQGGKSRRRNREQIETELAEVRAAIGRAEAQLAEAQRRLDVRKPAFAIVPYRGPHGTQRRPVYVECRADAVILQPEGIELRAEDFEGPMGPGNPLAAALRAKREYLVGQAGLDPTQSGEPYPLILVRPDGVVAYAAVRDAIKSWGDEFGYELIGDDWQVQFPPADPRLKATLQQTIAAARVQQRALAAAAPRHYGSHGRRASDSTPVYRAAPGGGVMLESGQSEDRTTRAGRGGSRFGDRSGLTSADRVAGNPTATIGNGAGGRTGRSTDRDGRLQIASGGSTQRDQTDGAAEGERRVTAGQLASLYGNPAGTQGAPELGDGSPVARRGMAADRGSTNGSPDSERATTQDAAASRPDAAVTASGSGATTSDATSGGATAEAEGMIAGRPGQIGAPTGAGSVGGSSGSSATGQAGPSAVVRPGEWHEPQDVAPLAETKGYDWALRGATARATPIVRPIRIDLTPEQLIVAAQSGGPTRQVVSLNDNGAVVAEQLVDAVWDVLDGWGLAGREMYWQPILRVNVTRGAERQFVRLRRLLEGSGLIIQMNGEG